MKAMMYTKDFNRIIAATKKFTAVNYSNPLLNWIRLEFRIEGTVKAIAIDGFKISVENTSGATIDEEFFRYVQPNIKTMKAEFIEIELIGNRLLITDDESIIGFVQPQGEYMDYEKILKDIQVKHIEYKIAFNTDYLIKALQSAKASGTDNHKMCTLEFRNNIEPVFIRTGNDNIKMVLPLRVK